MQKKMKTDVLSSSGPNVLWNKPLNISLNVGSKPERAIPRCISDFGPKGSRDGTRRDGKGRLERRPEFFSWSSSLSSNTFHNKIALVGISSSRGCGLRDGRFSESASRTRFRGNAFDDTISMILFSHDQWRNHNYAFL